jgi:serine/threonine-protein kinase
MQEIVSLAGMTIEGRYEVLEALGEERGSIVYAARQVATDRPVRLRVLPRALLGDPVILDRCNRSVRGASSLRHPNTLQTYAYGRLGDGEFYVVTEDVRGVTLRALLDSGAALPVERAAHIAAEVCSSLTEAHAIGVVHGALTPASIIVEQTADGFDRVRVADYGLGRFLLPETRMPGPRGKGIDRKDYESPEESEGHRAPDARSDLYTVGVVFYEMIAGQRASSKDAVVSSLWEVSPDHDVPVTIDALLSRTLSRAPEGRLPSAGVFRERLEEAVALLRRETRTVKLRKLSEYRRVSEAGAAGGRENGSGPLPAVSRAVGGGSAPRGNTTIPPVRLRRDRLQKLAVIGGAVALAAALVVTLLLLLEPWKANDGAGQPSAPEAVPVPGGDEPGARLAAAGGADAAAGDTAAGAARTGTGACSRVTLASTPPGAIVTRGGEVLGRTPFDACIPHGDDPWEMVVSAPDHASAPVRLDPSVGGRIELRLAPLPGGAHSALAAPADAGAPPDGAAAPDAATEPAAEPAAESEPEIDLEIVDEGAEGDAPGTPGTPAPGRAGVAPPDADSAAAEDDPAEARRLQRAAEQARREEEKRLRAEERRRKAEERRPSEPKKTAPTAEEKKPEPKKTEPTAEEKKPEPKPEPKPVEKKPEPKPVQKVDLPEPDF